MSLAHGLAVLGVALAASALWPSRADAQIRRCSAPDGSVIFTDRACADVGGVEHIPQAAPLGSLGGKTYARGCPRSLRDLVFEVSASIDSHDANRLAGVYHWTGMSGVGGYQVLSRLDAITQRPLVQITPVLPAARVRLDADAGLTVTGKLDPVRIDTPSAPSAASDTASPTAASIDTDTAAATSARRTPVGLRIDQTLANGVTASQTIFGLRRNMGCWFVTF
ncbi:MAG: hypothetical protein ACREO8_14750 [Luteimonas sp.]